MNKQLVVLAFLHVATSAARADSYDQVFQKMNAPDILVRPEKLPTRVPAAPPVDVTWIYGDGPGNLGSITHVVVDAGGTYSLMFHHCIRVGTDNQKLLAQPLMRCVDEEFGDHFNLISLKEFRTSSVMRHSDDSDTTELSGLTGPASIDDPHAVSFDVNRENIEYEIHFQYAETPPVLEFITTHKWQCSYKSTSPEIVHENCKGAMKSVARPGRGEDSSQTEAFDQDHYWWPTFQVFLRSPYDADKIVDMRRAGGRWSSQDISDKLLPAQKDQARALFAQGFDQYKDSNFSPARALFVEGLKIDPANYKAWQALGDVNKAAFKQAIASDHVVNYAFASQATFDYQRVIDLAPGSPEAIVVKSYLEDWGFYYNGMNSNQTGRPGLVGDTILK